MKRRYKIFLTATILSIIVTGGTLMGRMTIKMPGKSYKGPLPKLTREQKILSAEMKKHVTVLADDIGERNLVHYTNLNKAADYIQEELESYGYKTTIQTYTVPLDFLRRKWKKNGYDKHVYKNIIAELKGTEFPDEIIVIGSHYDSVPIKGCKAANDNASGVAATLALAKYFAENPQKRTIRFIGFTNEEPPFFWTRKMGSYVYAKSCKQKKENIVAMLTPETIGYYSDAKKSQKYPFPLNTIYPSTGNFIAFIGNTKSSELVKLCVKTFRETTKFPSEGAALPIVIPRIGASDHSSFWRMGYPGLMITDTAPYRYKAYHTDHDNTVNIDFDKMARVVEGLKFVLKKLGN